MGNMVVGRMVVTVHIKMTRLEMANCWTLRIGEVTETDTILVLILTSVMIDIIIIHI